MLKYLGNAVDNTLETLGDILGFESGPEDLVEARWVADDRERRVDIGVATLRIASQIEDQAEALELQARAAAVVAPVVDIKTATGPQQPTDQPGIDIEEARRRVQAA